MGCGSSSEMPKSWPSGVPIERDMFENWGRTQSVGHLWIAKPRNPADVVAIANWAAKMDPKERGELRPAGTRWSWSPVVFSKNTPNPNEKDLLLDMTGYADVYKIDKEAMEVTCAPGITILALLEALDKQDLTLGSYTGSGAMSIGGCIAVGAKGVVAPCKDPAANPPGIVYGSMTNFVTKFTLVVSTDSGKTYVEKEFVRGKDADAELLMAGIGRTVMTRVTLKVMPQFAVRARCFFDVPASVMFAPGTPGDESDPENSYADYVNQTGRISSIFIPFTDVCWTRTWAYCPQKPETSRLCEKPYNYPYQDQAAAWQTSMIEGILGQPHETFLEGIAAWVEKPFTDGAPGILSDAAKEIADVSQLIKEDIGLAKQQAKLTKYYNELQAKTLPTMNKNDKCEDLWGKSHNVCLFVNADLKIESQGITVLCKRANLQRNVHVTWSILVELVKEYQERGEYPLNGLVEWRVMALDEGKYVGIDGSSPALTSGSVDPETAESTGWDTMFVIELVHFPETMGFVGFSRELLKRYAARSELTGYEGRVTVEWSKPFAPGADGKFWSDEATMKEIRGFQPRWSEADAAMKKYDPAGLFNTAFNKWVFGSA